MSNEPQTQTKQQPQNNEPPATPTKDARTRIPISKLWFDDQQNLQGIPGASLVYSIDCAPQTAAGRQFYVAHFLPAWQVIELEWFRNEKAKASAENTAEYVRLRFPISRVQRFE